MRNRGPHAAEPAGALDSPETRAQGTVTKVESDTPGAICDIKLNTAGCLVERLEPGDRLTFVVKIRLAKDLTGRFVNEVLALSRTFDPDHENNSARDSTRIVG